MHTREIVYELIAAFVIQFLYNHRVKHTIVSKESSTFTFIQYIHKT